MRSQHKRGTRYAASRVNPRWLDFGRSIFGARFWTLDSGRSISVSCASVLAIAPPQLTRLSVLI